MSPEARALVESAAAPFRAAGRFAWHFARGKLRYDPVFLALLQRGAIAPGSRVLDLGCGQGVLFALLLAAERRYRDGAWLEGWRPPPASLSLRGIDHRAEAVRRARVALGDVAAFEHGDVVSASLQMAEVIVMMDVLHYLAADAQERVLDRIAGAVPRGGTFITRVGDAAAGTRFAVTRAGDWAVTLVHGTLRPRFCCRTVEDWTRLITARGFRVAVEPMNAGTPFANVLLTATRF
jgi:SAM-dependent methyltransferase